MNIIRIMNKKVLMFFGLLALLFAGCHQESLEERAHREAQEYTRKHCPQDLGNNVFLDSMVFEKDSRTLIQYCRISQASDYEEVILQKRAELDDGMIKATRQDVAYKRYRDAGCSFRYILRSDSSQKVLYDRIVTKDDYGF